MSFLLPRPVAGSLEATSRFSFIFNKGHVYNDELWAFLESKYLGSTLREFWEQLSIVARQDHVATRVTMRSLLLIWAYYIHDPPLPFLATTNRNALALAAANFINTSPPGHPRGLSSNEWAIVRSWSQGQVETGHRQDGSTINLYKLAKRLGVRLILGYMGLPDDLKLTLDRGIQSLYARAGQLKPGVQPQPDGSYHPEDFYQAFDPDDTSIYNIQILLIMHLVEPANWTPHQRELLTDVPLHEAELYDRIVEPVKLQNKKSYRKAQAKDRWAIRPLIDYGQLQQQMVEANGGRPLSLSTNAQLDMDNDNQSIRYTSHVLRKQVIPG